MKGPPPPPTPPPSPPPAPADPLPEEVLADKVFFAERKLRELELDHASLREEVGEADRAWWAWWRRFDSGQNARPLLYILLVVLVYLLLAGMF